MYNKLKECWLKLSGGEPRLSVGDILALLITAGVMQAMLPQSQLKDVLGSIILSPLAAYAIRYGLTVMVASYLDRPTILDATELQQNCFWYSFTLTLIALVLFVEWFFIHH